MPRGAKFGGRKKGTPNKTTGEARELFKDMFQRMAPEVEGYIRRTAEGLERPVMRFGEPVVTKDGTVLMYQAGADPGKAADLLLRLAEFHIPKLGRQELTGADGKQLSVSISINGIVREGVESPADAGPVSRF